MYKRCAIKFHNKKMEFINAVNMVARVKRARALPAGMDHLGIKQYLVMPSGVGNNNILTIKDNK